ncbi:uncharacterized protein LOC6566997 isoform X1 [Drosophila grimshawi]|uniref:uncharacterized protein LOC6566997 isoform X1 n=1 Tax=Drosophila grimshawi TaxID=7222 RepID=UPI000C86E728|nr:uncharacterized protein LOC6566997 isoform X1 [Drosophila grimshawi]
MSISAILLVCILQWLVNTAISREYNYTYNRIGDGNYFVGLEHTDQEFFDWFDARQSCLDHNGQLVSVQTEAKMIELQDYLVAKGYANGSTFSTSGHNFNQENPFSWDALKQRFNYSKWLPNEEPRLKGFVGLQLIGKELFMFRSWGYDQFYICEENSILQKLWLLLDSVYTLIFITFVLVLLICYKIRRETRSPHCYVKPRNVRK